MHDDLMLFLYIVDKGNYHQAAQTLKLSQSTITRRIQNLENRLGMQLLNRDTRAFQLTSAGQDLHLALQQEPDKFTVALNNITCHFQGLSGVLRINLSNLIDQDIINSIITKFVKQHPKVQFLISNSQSPNLVQSNFDIAISDMLPKSTTYQAELLSTYHRKLYASPQYIKNYGMPTSLAELQSAHNYVATYNSDGQPVSHYVVTNLKTQEENIFEINSQIYINDSSNILSFAQSHEYIIPAILPIINTTVKDLKLIEIMPDYSFGISSIYLITRSINLSPLEQHFIHILKDTF